MSKAGERQSSKTGLVLGKQFLEEGRNELGWPYQQGEMASRTIMLLQERLALVGCV